MTANRWVNEVSNGHTCRQAQGPNHQDVGGLEWLQNKQTRVIPARHKHQTKNSYPMAQAWTVAYLHLRNHFEHKGNL